MNLWLSLIATVGIVALVGGAYWYVSHLQSQVKQLSSENTVLTQDNKNLTETVKDNEKQQEIIIKVDAIGETERSKNRDTLQRQRKSIDDSVNRGEDKPVGKLLKDFLNGE